MMQKLTIVWTPCSPRSRQITTDSALESWKYGSRKGKEKEGYTVRAMEVEVYVARGVDRSEQAATLNLREYWMAQRIDFPTLSRVENVTRTVSINLGC